MRELCMAIAMVCALVTATSLPAAERAEFQISPRAGRGVLKLDQFRNVDDNRRSKWKLTSEDFPLLNDDDVERGYEYFWEVGFGKRINRVMSLAPACARAIMNSAMQARSRS
jgi:hypothetical protein